ncbi:hypothetical protein X727_33100 [Mesorhizobium sp. L103C119B0]|nr:hypothetical protein X727_33100 [Mesorhizobium sp. L103C119B0]
MRLKPDTPSDCRACSGFKRQPLKKIDADAPSLLKLLQRWRDEAGHAIKRIARRL